MAHEENGREEDSDEQRDRKFVDDAFIKMADLAEHVLLNAPERPRTLEFHIVLIDTSKGTVDVRTVSGGVEDDPRHTFLHETIASAITSALSAASKSSKRRS